MATYEQDDLIRKISALLRKAESTDNEAEASAFFAKANELIVKHSIDEAEVRQTARAQGKASDDIVQVYWMWATHDAHAKAKETLISEIAHSVHVRFSNFDNKPGSNRFREGNEGKYSQWGSLIGFPQDIENLKLMYASLLIQWSRFFRVDVQAWRLLTKVEFSSYVYDDATGRSRWQEKSPKEYGYKTGHLEGFAVRVGERLRNQEREIVEARNANALIVLKDKEISEWIDSRKTPNWYDKYCLDFSYSKRRFCGLLKGHEGKHVHTIKPARSSSKRDVDAGGYSAGQAAGSRADIGTPRTRIG